MTTPTKQQIRGAALILALVLILVLWRLCPAL
jgi:Tfp pilus assembly protein PilX